MRCWGMVTVDLLPTYPLTIAVQARDNADPRTGMEYANTSIGDGGFILKFSDGTVTRHGNRSVDDAPWPGSQVDRSDRGAGLWKGRPCRIL